MVGLNPLSRALHFIRIAKISCAILFAFLAVDSLATPVNAGSETIYILLTSNGGGGASANPLEILSNTGLKNYIQNNILANDSANIYATSVNLSEYTPEEYAGKFIARDSGKSILDSALKQWFDSSSVTSAVGKWKKANTKKNLEDLKKNRPGLVPSKFVFITEGAAGLAVREYIQSENYQGEIANVVFFNTPHEGAGIADQSMFNGTSILEKDDDATKYGTIISLALVAYVAGGVNGLQDLMISLLKDAVMGMAYNMGGHIGSLGKVEGFY